MVVFATPERFDTSSIARYDMICDLLSKIIYRNLPPAVRRCTRMFCPFSGERECVFPKTQLVALRIIRGGGSSRRISHHPRGSAGFANLRW